MQPELKELWRVTLLGMVVTLLFWVIVACAFAFDKTYDIPDEDYVQAIYKAEGGAKAQYLYGIRSVKYASAAEARKICFNTVRNNKKRFAKYGHKSFDSFISFLASRYCPTQGLKLSQSERKLNKNWIKNVSFFLGLHKTNGER